jgi:anti-sigma factor RsiW
MSHARPEELELYVLGALERDACARLEGHLRGCSPCSAALAAEARIEETLRDLVPTVRRAPAKIVRLPDRRPAPGPAKTAGGWSGMMAAAAIVVAVWGLSGSRMPAGGGRSAVAEAGVMVCEAAAEEPLCAWPAASFANPADNVCRELSCPVLQSRMR